MFYKDPNFVRLSEFENCVFLNRSLLTMGSFSFSIVFSEQN